MEIQAHGALIDVLDVGVLLLGGAEEAQTHDELCRGAAAARVVSAGTDLSYGRFAAVTQACQVLVTGEGSEGAES